MLWEEDTEETAALPGDIVDLAFSIDCRVLPTDHAYALSAALHRALPWFGQEPDAGLHLVHGAESGNGWLRPQEEGGTFYLSRRTKLTLRLPQTRVEEAYALCGQTLDIAGHSLSVGKAAVRPLMSYPVLFARHVAVSETHDESDFIRETADELKRIGIHCRKMMCGRAMRFILPDGVLFTRSLMVADLALPDAVRLQQKGLGTGRKIGCGVFIPHKDIKPVSLEQEKSA